MEKFSVKESLADSELGPFSSLMMDLTNAIAYFERQLINNSLKNWRQIKMFYEQLNIAIDGQDKGDPVLNQEEYEKGWSENHPELLMQYFMLNKLASDLIINAITQVQEGAA